MGEADALQAWLFIVDWSIFKDYFTHNAGQIAALCAQEKVRLAQSAAVAERNEQAIAAGCNALHAAADLVTKSLLPLPNHTVAWPTCLIGSVANCLLLTVARTMVSSVSRWRTSIS